VAGSFYSDQYALIALIARSLPISHRLYVKVHPTDVDGKSLGFYKKIANLPNVSLIDFSVDSKRLVQSSDIVFTLTGTVGFEAAIMGKKVITFGRNFYNKLPLIHYCESLINLPNLISEVLYLKYSGEEYEERLITALIELNSISFEGEINGMAAPGMFPLDSQSLEGLSNAYSKLYEYYYPQ
jgi:hypothetical protein